MADFTKEITNMALSTHDIGIMSYIRLRQMKLITAAETPEQIAHASFANKELEGVIDYLNEELEKRKARNG